MKFDENDIIDFLDNEMDKSKFSDFFRSLSLDRELMFEFINHKRLKDTFAYRSEINEPTDDLDRQVILGLGLNPDPWELTMFQKFKNLLKNRMIIAVTSSIATILLMLLLYPFGNSNNTFNDSRLNHEANENISDKLIYPLEYSDKKANLSDVDMKKQNAIKYKTNSKTNLKEQKRLNDKTPIESLLSDNKDIMKINKTESVSKTDIDKNDETKNINYLENQTINSYKINDNRIINFNFDNSNDKIENTLNMDAKDNELRDNNSNNKFNDLFRKLQFEFKHSQDFYSSSQRIINLNVSPFNKINLSLFYRYSSNLFLGFGLKQETYSISFNEFRPDSIIIYYKQPNITTLSFDLKYIYFDYKNIIKPFTELSIGGNGLGLLIRGKFGVEYYPIPNAYFIVGADMSYLLFRDFNNTFSSNKYSLTYGIGFKF